MDFEKFSALFKLRIEEMQSLVQKTNKSSVLVVQQFPVESDTEILLPMVRESISNILAFVEMGTVEVLNHIIEKADGVFDAFAMDTDLKCKNSQALVNTASKGIKKSKFFQYSDNNTWADAAMNFINIIEGRELQNKKILIAGTGILADKIIFGMHSYTHNLFHYNEHNSENDTFSTMKIATPVDKAFDWNSVGIIIGAAVKKESIPSSLAQKLNANVHLYDAGIGNFSKELIQTVEGKGGGTYRLDTRVGISSLVINLLETDYLVNNIMGKVKIKDVEIVSGGVMGADGAVIVDNVNHPSHIVGIADGEGKIKTTITSERDKKAYDFVARLLR